LGVDQFGCEEAEVAMQGGFDELSAFLHHYQPYPWLSMRIALVLSCVEVESVQCVFLEGQCSNESPLLDSAVELS